MLSLIKRKDKLFYGWVMVITLLIIGTTLLGVHQSFGIFFKSIAGEFHLTRAATSAIFSANMILAGICALVGGWASDRYGPRIVFLLMGIFTGIGLLLTSQTNSPWQLFITYSLLLSMGTGATYVVLTATIARWFDKKRGLAMGIAGTGQGLGPLIVAPVATYLIINLDWRMTYIIMGVIVWLVVIPLSRLLKKDPRQIGALPDGAHSPSNDITCEEEKIQPYRYWLLQILRNRYFWFLLFAFMFYMSCLLLVFTHLVPHATDIGFSAGEAAAVLSLIGGTTIAGRIIMGIASDRIGRRITVIIGALLMTGAMLWLNWSVDLWMLYLFALVFGFATGGFDACMATLMGDTFDIATIGAVFGVLEIGVGIGGAIGPAMGGLIFDATHSYSMAFLISAASMVVVALLITLVKPKTAGNF